MFRIKHRSIEPIRNGPLLNRKKLLGKGSFCGVFEGSRPDTVYKLTRCQAHYAYMTDGLSPESPHKPKLIHDFGQVGNYENDSNRDCPIYLIEVERLFTLDRGHYVRRLVDKLTDEQNLDFWESHMSERGIDKQAKTFFLDLLTFVSNFSGFEIDAHVGSNYMKRADGTWVASDPVFDTSACF